VSDVGEFFGRRCRSRRSHRFTLNRSFSVQGVWKTLQVLGKSENLKNVKKSIGATHGRRYANECNNAGVSRLFPPMKHL
jgi:hypothetical protein